MVRGPNTITLLQFNSAIMNANVQLNKAFLYLALSEVILINSGCSVILFPKYDSGGGENNFYLGQFFALMVGVVVWVLSTISVDYIKTKGNRARLSIQFQPKIPSDITFNKDETKSSTVYYDPFITSTPELSTIEGYDFMYEVIYISLKAENRSNKVARNCRCHLVKIDCYPADGSAHETIVDAYLPLSWAYLNAKPDGYADIYPSTSLYFNIAMLDPIKKFLIPQTRGKAICV